MYDLTLECPHNLIKYIGVQDFSEVGLELVILADYLECKSTIIPDREYALYPMPTNLDERLLYKP